MNVKPLEDTDPMPFGAHSGKPMQDVPAAYLHWCWNNVKPTNDKAKQVLEYIKTNLEALKKEHKDGIWS